MESKPYLSVVIPCYNERERLLRVIPGMVDYLTGTGKPYEIVIVNDGSRDDTAQVAERLAERFPGVRLISYTPNRGKGGAVKTGMLDARGDYVIFADADQSTPIQEVEKLLPKVERDGYGMAIGSRAVAGADVEQAQAWYRDLAGKLFGLATRVLCIHGIADTQCGFKLMTREVAKKVFPQVTSNTAIFDIEMLLVATREGYRIAEVPVHWVHDPDTRIPYDLRQAVRIWLELLRIKRAEKVIWPRKAKT